MVQKDNNPELPAEKQFPKYEVIAVYDGRLTILTF